MNNSRPLLSTHILLRCVNKVFIILSFVQLIDFQIIKNKPILLYCYRYKIDCPLRLRRTIQSWTKFLLSPIISEKKRRQMLGLNDFAGNSCSVKRANCRAVGNTQKTKYVSSNGACTEHVVLVWRK